MSNRTAPRSPLLVAAAAVVLLLGGSAAGAQAIPPPSQAQGALNQALQQNPQLPEMIRSRIRDSGLTPEQVRARLRASGYPESLLDPYLGTAMAGQPSTTPGSAELAALQALGLPLTQAMLPVDTGMVRARGGLGAPATPSSVFGVDVFQRTTTQFLPLLSGPVPADYKLGAGDMVALILTGDVELAYSLQVTREGYLLIPQVGQVFASNLTLEHLRDLLYTRLGRVYSGVRRGASASTRFDVSVTNVRANQVYVVGEVMQPGAYQISSLGTVLTALYAAGGLLERGNTRAIQVQRGGKAAATFDLYDYLLAGDTRNDIRLETGDVVFVPVHGARVWITGAVRRPAIYEMVGEQGLRDAVVAAGGFRADASLRRVTVHRILPGGDRGQNALARTAIDVALSQPTPSSPGSGERGEVHSAPERVGEVRLPVTVPSLRLEDGDSVVVDSLPALGPDAYFVAVAGMVHKPGQFPWRPGITLREAVRLAGGPRVGAELREAEIARLPADRSQGQMATTVRVPLDSTYLFDRDSAGRYIGPDGIPFPAAGSAADVELQPFDNILILRQPNFELQRTVVILGQVRYPGWYALRSKDDRLSDLVGRAGGLTPQAYAEGVRFYRSLYEAGRINVKLDQALENPRSRDDVILSPGDSVFVPEFIPSVKVAGAVNAPGSVLYKPGADMSYYISAAGGFAPRAQKGASSVRYANGEVRAPSKFLFFRSDPNPDPGSEVFVPLKDPGDRVDWVALAGGIAAILASTVAIIVVATQ